MTIINKYDNPHESGGKRLDMPAKCRRQPPGYRRPYKACQLPGMPESSG
jgi:hypothetical protein